MELHEWCIAVLNGGELCLRGLQVQLCDVCG